MICFHFFLRVGIDRGGVTCCILFTGIRRESGALCTGLIGVGGSVDQIIDTFEGIFTETNRRSLDDITKELMFLVIKKTLKVCGRANLEKEYCRIGRHHGDRVLPIALLKTNEKKKKI